jgi:hypothetical protein
VKTVYPQSPIGGVSLIRAMINVGLAYPLSRPFLKTIPQKECLTTQLKRPTSIALNSLELLISPIEAHVPCV